ncbi:sugar phosphate isomerase/epimerase family protein [Paenibacillus alkalitolerans]|uniref:sugar phosphate isomerase/epimerase family protein n=1 Tax=Paenibacillus alkalitolerans TaxID=2799335 RepID=UPI0018F2DC2B|nr:sugar phosphate isomerase/epimerase family protein [Paenibacillus alkalitolerans]
MKIALNTSYISDTGNADSVLKRIKEAGFSGIQWIHDWNSDYMYSESEMEQIAGWLARYGLIMHDVHASKGDRKDYMSFDEYRRRAGVDLIKNRIDLAAHCGAGVIVLHMPVPVAFRNSPSWDRLFAQVFASFDELQPYCHKKGVKIAVENLVQTNFDLEVRQFTMLFERYDKDFLGLCYDSGHANCAFQGHEESIGFLDMFLDRLLSVHLTDNDGTGDLHWVPFTGTVDWDGIARLIAKSGYEGGITLESVLRRSGLEDETAYLAECFLRAERFRELVERYKQI